MNYETYRANEERARKIYNKQEIADHSNLYYASQRAIEERERAAYRALELVESAKPVIGYFTILAVGYVIICLVFGLPIEF